MMWEQMICLSCVVSLISVIAASPVQASAYRNHTVRALFGAETADCTGKKVYLALPLLSGCYSSENPLKKMACTDVSGTTWNYSGFTFAVPNTSDR